jgi:hypothetical protein
VRRFLREVFAPDLEPTDWPPPSSQRLKLSPASVATVTPGILPAQAVQTSTEIPMVPECAADPVVAAQPETPTGMRFQPLPASGPGSKSSTTVATSAPSLPAKPTSIEKHAEEPTAPIGPPVHLVNDRSIRINGKLRDVGPSGVSAVELWLTRDGQQWKKERTLPAQPPFVFDVPEDGRYGITLLPRSGAGMSRQSPAPGEAPQIWVEVDTVRPVVKMGPIKALPGEQGRDAVITWLAEDRNLGPHPIRLSYAEKPEGPWRTITETENTGSFRWHMPEQMPARVFIRVEATDSAGNVGVACANEPVLLDMSRPAVDIVWVGSNRKK